MGVILNFSFFRGGCVLQVFTMKLQYFHDLFLSGVGCWDPSRAGPSRAERGRAGAERGRAGPSRADSVDPRRARAEPSRAGPGRAGPGRAGAGPSRAGPEPGRTPY